MIPLWKHEPWDSEILGVPVARVFHSPWAASRQCNDESISYLFAKIPWTDSCSIRHFQDCGFQAICSEIKMSADSASSAISTDCRPATLSDEESLCAVASSGFSHSRFHLDPTVPPLAAHASRARWVSNALHNRRGIPCDIYVLTDYNAIIGFVVCGKLNTSSTIDLIAVHPNHRRLGHGTTLCLHALYHLSCCDLPITTTVNTSNIPALHMYLSVGFRPVEARLVVRKWLGR